VQFYIFIILFICSTFNTVFAHHGGEGGLGGAGIAGPIITIPAYPLKKGSRFISIITNYLNEDIFSNNTLKEFGKRGEDVDVVENALSPSVVFGLGITEKLTVSAGVPYIFRYGIRRVEQSPEIQSVGNSIGIGDINLFSIYEIYHNEDRDFHIALLSGLNIPSGVRRDRDKKGILFRAEHQPSTGSFDPQIGLAISKHTGPFHIDTNGLYRFSTRGIQDTILGDIASYNFAISYLVGSREKKLEKLFVNKVFGKEAKWHLIFEANGSWVEKPKIKSIREENEGGTLIYLSPGIRLIWNKNWITNISVGLPTIDDLNGRRQPPNIRLIYGITKVF